MVALTIAMGFAACRQCRWTDEGRWIQLNKVTGVLTAYPLDEGVFDWALRMDLVSDRVRPRGKDPIFVAGFSSAMQEHYHYEDGARAGADER